MIGKEKLIVEVYNKIVSWYNEELDVEEKSNLLFGVTIDIINTVINFIAENSQAIEDEKENNPEQLQ